MKDNNLKQIVQEKYSAIASQASKANTSSCCGSSGCCGDMEISMIGDEYKDVEGYNPDADMGLGCGIPTLFAGILKGDHVLDLGSGAGNDCFVARIIVGKTGRVAGLDFTDAMIAKAIENNRKLGYTNVDFVKGDIEEMPFSDETFKVIISNCVLNLVPDKHKAFAEIWRVLKPGGHFCVSDVVLKGSLPDQLRKDAEMYAGCVSGAIEMDAYLDIISKQGFSKVTVHKEKEIELPLAVLKSYLPEDEIHAFKESGSGIYSITVSAYRH